MNFSNTINQLALATLLVCFAVSPALSQTPATQEEAKPAAAANQEKETAATEEPEPLSIKVAEDTIHFTATGTWKSVPPASRMLAAELKIPRVDEDTADGRLTIMGAGGTIEANIVRWQGQFIQADGSETSENTKQEQKKIDGQTVNMVDISGTFLDAVGGPFSGKPKVERENYRMIAAIIQTEGSGNYFVKFYGPKATVDKNAEHFKAMIESLKVSKAVH